MSGITFTFSDASTRNSDIIKQNWTKTEVLYKDLKSADSTMRLSIPFDVTTFNKLKAETADLIPAVVSNASNEVLFTGYVRNTFSYSKRQKNLPMSLELVTAGFKLDVNTTTYHEWENETLGEIITDLSALAGLDIDVTEDTVVPVYFIDEDENIKAAVNQLLSEYGYSYTFSASGAMILKKLFPAIPETPAIEFNGQNCLGEIKAKKNERKYGGAEISWHEIKSILNQKIYEEENISIPAGTYLHGAETVYLEYDCEQGTPVKITNASVIVEWSSGTLSHTFTNYPKRGAISMYNNSGTEKIISKLAVKGSGYVQSDLLIETTTLTDGKQNYKFKCKTLSVQAQVQALARNIADYYRYSLFQFSMQSKTDCSIGEYVTVTDGGFGTSKGRIVQKDTNYQTGVFSYIVESVSDYVNAVVDDSYAEKKYENRLQGEQGFTGGTDGYQEYEFAWNYNENNPPADDPTTPEGGYPVPSGASVEGRWYDAPPTDVPVDGYLWSRTRFTGRQEATYALRFQGNWNAQENVPPLSDATGERGHFYRISASATRNLGSGAVSWVAGKQVTFNGTKWEQSEFDAVGLFGYTPANSNLVPNEASPSNQLSDKNFVNSSIATNTANFLGTNTTATTETDFLTWANALSGKTNNDYVFWQTTDSSGNTIYKRYKYNGTSWIFEYNLNNSSFTAQQWATINSGLGAADKTKLDEVPNFPLSAGDGGTGETSLNASANALINALSVGSDDPVDDDYIVTQYVGGGTSSTNYYRRKISKLWNYIKGKIVNTFNVNNGKFRRLTTGQSKLYIKINSTERWMISFVLTVYQAYEATKIMISGYNYGENLWYRPRAVLLGGSGDITSVNVYFCYESVNNLVVGIDTQAYTSVSISDVVVGYLGPTDFSNLFTIEEVSTLPTIHTTVVAKNKVLEAVNAVNDANGYLLRSSINLPAGNGTNKYFKLEGEAYIVASFILQSIYGSTIFIYGVGNSYCAAVCRLVNTTYGLHGIKSAYDSSTHKNTIYIRNSAYTSYNINSLNRSKWTLTEITETEYNNVATAGTVFVRTYNSASEIPLLLESVFTKKTDLATWTECTITPTQVTITNLKAYYNSTTKTLAFKGTLIGEIGSMSNNPVVHLTVTLPIDSNFTESKEFAIPFSSIDYSANYVEAYGKTVSGTKQINIYLSASGPHDPYSYTLGSCVII